MFIIVQKLKIKAKIETLSTNVEARRREWLNRVSSEDDFKEEDPSKFFGKRNVMAKTQTSSKERAEIVARDFQEGHLPQERFNETAPSKAPLKWLKDRTKSTEQGLNLKYNFGNEIDRVKDQKKNILKPGVFEPCDTKTLYFTKLREHDKSKWQSEKTFVGTSGNMDKGWEKVPIKEKGEYEPFSPKYTSIAEFSRKRDKNKEVTSLEWDAFSRSDSVWQSRVQTSNSLRTYSSIKGFIKSINGKVQNFSRGEAKETLDSMRTHQESPLVRTAQLSSREPSRLYTHSSHSNLHAAVPTSFKIQKGDLHKVQEFLTLKKEYTQKSSLVYLPNQQIKSTMNTRFKGPIQITDQYLIDRVEGSRQKTYYKSAETDIQIKKTQQQSSFQKHLNAINLAQLPQEPHSGLPEIVTQLDIGQMLLNEKMSGLGSKDSSPLLGSNRMLKEGSEDNVTENSSFIVNQIQSQQESLQQQNQYQNEQGAKQIGQHISIQEESDETDEDSPLGRKKRSLGLSSNARMNINENLLTRHLNSQSRLSKKQDSQGLTKTKSGMFLVTPLQSSANEERDIRKVIDSYFTENKQKINIISPKIRKKLGGGKSYGSSNSLL